MPTLADIFGQDAAIEILLNAWRSQRLPHGMIFAGPQGVGKATTARALATLFLCENPKKDQPCGKCESCVLMEVKNADGTSNHPDFHFVYRQLIRLEKDKSKAKELTVPLIRAYVVDRAGRTPKMNRGSVFVIKEADLMNPAAQNALLKTLEEPPGRTLVILLTDQPHCLLPTIRSRAQMIPFAALDVKLVARELEKRGMDKGPAAEAAGLAEGSLGLAMRWIEDGVIDTARQLMGQIEALASGERAGDLADFLKKAAEAYAEKQLVRDELASKDQANKEGLSLYLKLAANRLRRKLSSTAAADHLEQVCVAIDAIIRAENYLDSNVNAGLVLQQLAVTLERELTSAAMR